MLAIKALLSTVLVLAGMATAMEEMSMFTDDLDLLNLWGVEDFLDDGWAEQGLILHGVTFHENYDQNGTYPRDQGTAPTDYSRTSRKRAPLDSCSLDYCERGQYELFSPAQQAYITGMICPKVVPYLNSGTNTVIGFLVSKALCNAGDDACTLFFSLGIGFGATAADFGNRVKARCKAEYQMIIERCGLDGGSVTCTSSNPADPQGMLTARVVATAPANTDRCISGTDKCYGVTCTRRNNNCQSYGEI